jgi:hypothetical protein
VPCRAAVHRSRRSNAGQAPPLQRRTVTILGLDVLPLPNGYTPLEATAVIKALDEEGCVSLLIRSTDGLNAWESLGMLDAAVATTRPSLPTRSASRSACPGSWPSSPRYWCCLPVPASTTDAGSRLLKSCAECGALSDQARCPLHRRGANAHWSKGRDRTAQDKFRKALIRMYGMRCAAVVDGVRCPVTTGLQAHHTQPGNDDPRTGALLCTEHHRAVDAHAR